MARQPYQSRLVLGRSAFQSPIAPSTAVAAGSDVAVDESQGECGCENPRIYVQEYDGQGYKTNPRSKELARQSRRAQNDILSTVKVCVRVDKNGLPAITGTTNDKLRMNEIRKENSCGLLLGTADWCFFCLTNLCLVGLRHRLQTFSFYTDVALTDIIKIEWKYLDLLFPGAVATFLFRYLEHARSQRLRSLYNRLTRQYIWPVRSATRRKRLRMALDVLEQVFKVAAFALIAPLEIFSTLQHLNLAPMSLLLPRPRAMIPFSSLSPFQFLGLTYTTFGGYVRDLATSPVILLWLLSLTKSHVDERLYVYIGSILPKPTSPTTYSEDAAREDGLTNEHILGLSETDDSRITSHDFRRAYLGFIGIPARLVSIFVQAIWVGGGSTFREKEELRESHQEATSDNTHVRASMSPITSPSLSSTPQTLDTPLARSRAEISDPHPFARVDMDEQLATNVEDVTTASQRVHEAARLPTRLNGSSLRLATSPRHHVTALSSHTADALAMHLSTHLADLLFLPLEALFVRSVALGFLSAATRSPAGSVLGLRTQVIPLRRWFGPGISLGSSFRYTKNLVLCGAVEVAVGFGIWQLSAGAAWLMGSKWFHWADSAQDEAASEWSSRI